MNLIDSIYDSTKLFKTFVEMIAQEEVSNRGGSFGGTLKDNFLRPEYSSFSINLECSRRLSKALSNVILRSMIVTTRYVGLALPTMHHSKFQVKLSQL